MEEPGEWSKDSFCYGCLSQSDEICSYALENEALKAMLQVDQIPLCYLCKRFAQHTELFVQNVQSNQIFMLNFDSITKANLQTMKLQTQPLASLSHVQLDVIELGNENSHLDEFIIFGKQSEVKIKEEKLDDEENDFQDNMEENLTELDPYVKEEDDYPLKLLKEELDSEGIIIKCLNKKGKDKRKQTKNKIKDIRIETIFITREQCMEERAVKATTDKKYMNSMFKCEDCIKGFNFKDSYDKHMEGHSETNGDYVCDICKLRMISLKTLQNHQRYHTLRYKCGECNLTRISRLTVKDHYTAHHCNGAMSYTCHYCFKPFKRQVSLRKHIAYVHEVEQRVHCAYCNKTYSSKPVLRSHLMAMHANEVSEGNIQKRYVCKDCGKAFKAPSQLKNHIVKHSQRQDYYCVECDKRFKTHSNLKFHLKTANPHVKYLDLPLTCEHCDRRFSVRRNLERHINRVHLNFRPHRCDQCDKAYINTWSLNEHKRLIHEGYKRPHNIPCPMCDKVFNRNQILKAHIRTHTGERPYQCSKCPAQFTQRSVLGTHVKLVHLKLTRDGRPKHMGAGNVK